MWKGITLSDTSVYADKHSYISDAQYAVKAATRNLISLASTTFVNNFESVYVPQIGSLFYNTTTINMSSCYFYGSGYMKMNYYNQSPPTGNLPFAGVNTNNVTLTITPPSAPDANHFIYMSNGIISRHGNTTINNCEFLNIQPDAAYDSLSLTVFNTTFNGSGIYAHGWRGGYLLSQTGFGKYGAKSFPPFQMFLPPAKNNCDLHILIQKIPHNN